MSRPSPYTDERQPILFDDLPPSPPVFSDTRAKSDMMAMIYTLEKAKTPPWSMRLLGWQRRTFATLAQKLTPLEAAVLTARFDGELERLGPPID